VAAPRAELLPPRQVVPGWNERRADATDSSNLVLEAIRGACSVQFKLAINSVTRGGIHSFILGCNVRRRIQRTQPPLPLVGVLSAAY